jgi:hypothetical protein
MPIQFQFRRDTAAIWYNNNPLLASGEMGIETDTRYIKIGDGISLWRALPYALQGGSSGTGPTGSTGSTGPIGSTGPTGPPLYTASIFDGGIAQPPTSTLLLLDLGSAS